MTIIKSSILMILLMFFLCGTAIAEDLLTIYQQALEADPTLKSSEIKIKIGEAQKGQALGEMFPQITGTANWSTNRQETGVNARGQDVDYRGTRYAISLNQTILDFAKFWNWRRAQSVENQYSLENIEAQHELIFNVVDNYFSVLEAEDELSFFKAEEDITQQQLEQMQKLYDRQMVKITDVYAIEARLDQVKASIIEAEAKLVTAKEGLKELTNTNPKTLLKLRDEIDFKVLDGKLDDWLQVAKSENPTIAAQKFAIEAADHDVTVQKSRHLPVVELQMNYYNTDTGFQSQALNQGIETRVASINVNVPIFSGGVTHRRMQEAQHKLSLNKYDKEAKERELIKTTSDAFLNTNANVKRIKATKKALESATKSREAMETGFGYGVETISDVLDAQKEEFTVMRELAKSKYGYIKNRIRFQQAIGMIGDQNLGEINQWLQTAALAENKLTTAIKPSAAKSPSGDASKEKTATPTPPSKTKK